MPKTKIKKTPKKDEQKELKKTGVLELKSEKSENAETETENREENMKLNGNGKEKYYQAIGRRKESIARIRFYTKKSTDTVEDEKALITINGKDYADYFSDVNLRNIVESPLRKLKSLNRFKASVVVRGGGLTGQADAIKHGLSRALVQFDINFKNMEKTKEEGYLNNIPQEKNPEIMTISGLNEKIKIAQEAKERILEKHNLIDSELSEEVKLSLSMIDNKIDSYKKEIEDLESK